MGMNFVGILKEILKAVTGICLKFLMPSASLTKTSEKLKLFATFLPVRILANKKHWNFRVQTKQPASPNGLK